MKINQPAHLQPTRVMDRKLEKGYLATNKKWIWSTLSLVLIIPAYYLLQSFHTNTFRIPKEKIQTALVQKGKFDEFIAVSGSIEPLKTVIVVAMQSGIVEEKFFEDGARPEKGDALVKLANQDLQLEFMSRESDLLDRLNNLRNTNISMENNNLSLQQQYIELERQFSDAQRVYEANKRLYRDSLISSEEFLLSQSNFNSLKQRKQLLKGSLENNNHFFSRQSKQLNFSSQLIEKNLISLKKNLEKLTVKSPASGMLTGFGTEIGQNITKGETVAEIDLLQGYRLNVSVDELYISRMQKGLKGSLEYNGTEYVLEVDKVYSQVNNGQFRIDVVFTDDVPEGLKYGQNLPLRISLGKPGDALLLKRGGFYQNGGKYVFVVKDKVARKRNVKLGRQNPSFFEIKEGLEEGEEVIVSGYDIFGDAEEIELE